MRHDRVLLAWKSNSEQLHTYDHIPQEDVVPELVCSRHWLKHRIEAHTHNMILFHSRQVLPATPH